MDTFLDIDLLYILPAIALGAIEATKSQQTPRNTGLPGGVYLQELLESSDKRIYDVLRMKKETFNELCNWLKVYTELTPQRVISVEEQVAMFLWTINYSASVRQVEERFQHSTDSISR